MFSWFHPDLTVKEPFLNLPDTSHLLPLLVVTLQVRSPIRSKLLSVNPVYWSSLTPGLIINQLLRPHMLISRLLLLQMWTRPLSILISQFLATTRETSQLDLCGGFWRERFSVFVDLSLGNCPGTLCLICFSTATLKRPKRRSKPAKRPLQRPKMLPMPKHLKRLKRVGAVKK